MSRRKRLSLSGAALVLLMLSAQEGYACSCGQRQTVLEAYEWAGVVVLARAVSLETVPERGAGEQKSGAAQEAKPGDTFDERATERRRVVSTKMLIERVYKGGLKVGEELVMAQGSGADCIYTFDSDDIGRAYLFYLKPLKGADFWMVGTCGRSRPVEGAAHDDLLYLNNLDKTRGRTRISGSLGYFLEEGPAPAGLKITIKGGGKTFETKTDEHGVYEIYDVPAGKYTLEPEVPQGWKVGNFRLGQPSSPVAGDDERSPKKIPFVVEEKRHVGLDINFMIDNAVSGKVFDTSGRPLDGVCLSLLPARGEIPKYYYKGDCTESDEGGQFSIAEVPPGDYVLVINRDGKVTSSTPFGTIYYPNAKTREEATVFHIGLGEFVENLEFRITKMEETITVEGLLLHSDGKPVADTWVEFRTEKNTDEYEDVDSQTRSDAQGRFTLKILKGQRGTIYSTMGVYLGQYVNCPRLDRLIRQTGRDDAELKTTTHAIQADNNLYGVELRFPFPFCKKAKVE